MTNKELKQSIRDVVTELDQVIKALQELAAKKKMKKAEDSQ